MAGMLKPSDIAAEGAVPALQLAAAARIKATSGARMPER